MRDILFRAKNINNQWRYGYLERQDLLYDENFDCSSTIQIETLGQYTGLKDKNGTKIFEGDIIKCKKMGNEYIVIVEWSDLLATYDLRYLDKPIHLCELSFAEDIEVIDNIYDNPELLEKAGD